MTIRVAIRHNTHYQFDRPVALAPHVFRLKPAPHCRTPIEAYSLKIEPEGHFINWLQDPFGNYQARVVFPDMKATRLSVEVEVIADLKVINPFDFFVEEDAKGYPFKYEKELKKELAPYLEMAETSARLKKWVKEHAPKKSDNIVQFLFNLNQALFKSIGYTLRMEPGVQTCEDTLRLGTGSCRDSGWLLVQIFRHLGLAARFVSGYLVQLAPDVESLDGPSGPSEDFTDLHAWAEVYVPGAGWLGLDPTSGLFAGEGHIPLACTASPSSAAPITGATDECEVEFSFSNTVERIHEDPRVTKPYTDAQWQHIMALGNKVDDFLSAEDVRLTMGGEPTFVSVDDMESAQWNTAADGPEKRQLAHDLFLRMQAHFAPGALLHYGQGKWYPGEPVPRWQYGCYWRRDGEPLWRDASLLANPNQPGEVTIEQAKAFAEHLTAGLKLPGDCLIPAFEDVVYYLWEEGNLPVDFDPLAENLKETDARARLLQHLQRGLNEPVGFVLPLGWDFNQQRFHSCRWAFRRGHCFLVPGNSPLGLRLPLSQLTDPAQADELQPQPRSLFEPVRSLTEFSVPEYSDTHQQTYWVQTALGLEIRNGLLHVFMPPLTHIEHSIILVQALESAAAALKLPVVLEGYEPPRDNRIERFMVTPDPGVIEVNIHPASHWQTLVNNTEALYDLAHRSRLGTEKFMLDGRHTGTGGGNHVTLGGATPQDSPLLRRPSLLRSLITYWQHHPSLSYLFSGLFIGPTSQAPRVDEGRDEALYELEIAFSQLPDGEVPQPWLVDRVLRNLLVDITGNTHRSEFCIDKLYSPDSATGRLGILEFRGFEMPPHARMSLVQLLLLRVLVARFWDKPYKHRLVRWGTELHDRFLLPHYVEQDLRDVCNDLQQAGYAYQYEWLLPFMEFRFPVIGRVQIKDITIELRQAIEPWHVLGEESTSQGTSRFVDSSVERLQVKVTGISEERFLLTCNGRRVNWHATGVPGEFVSGIRYRAWSPPSALHPTIGVHSPLVFDLIDRWNGRSLGGCAYHVSHAGGRSYEIFPVNAYEAEGRRINRFFDEGHSAGPVEIPPQAQPWISSEARFYPRGEQPQAEEPVAETDNTDYPYTLDLRFPLRQPY